VITTPNAGSVVRDGIDGYLVPVRSGDALATRIARLASDPALVREMSQRATERARDFTLKAYAARLVHALLGDGASVHETS
jgi:glycosyltransferase involved in cell wall biosynthesis